MLFSTVAAPTYIPTNSVGAFAFPKSKSNQIEKMQKQRKPVKQDKIIV